MKTTLVLNGLNCPNCANKIEAKIKKDSRFSDVEFNFINKQLILSHKLNENEIVSEIDKIVSSIEDGITVLPLEAEENVANNHSHKHSHHSHEAKNKNITILRFVAIVALIAVYAIVWKEPIIIAFAYIIASYDVISSAVKNILKGHIFDENFLMSIATLGALALGEYTEALAVMVFYQIGEFFQDMAVDKSKKSISDLMDLKVEKADLVQGESIISIEPSEIKIGDILLIKTGSKIPVDGIVIDGSTVVDTSALTGESIPRDLACGDKVLSGCINQGNAIKIKAEKKYSDSTTARIIEMAENATAHKSKAENFLSAFAGIYTPIVVISAILLAVIPCVISGYDTKWIYRGLVFLVASCPCALVLSVPLCFFSGIGKASKQGILIKGSNYIQTLSKIKLVAFDKTGTLTTGKFAVKNPENISGECLAYAAALEKYSNHPISNAIIDVYNGEPLQAENIEEIGGFGIKGKINGNEVAAGSKGLMDKLNIPLDNAIGDVYVAVNGRLLGTINVSDSIKADSSTTVHALEAMGVKTAMLTGDKAEKANEIGGLLGISQIKSQLLPDEKLTTLQELRKKYGTTAFMGDGINDAPVLAGADVGVAMGGIGSDAAIEAADVVIMGDNPSAILRAVQTSKKTMTILKQNVIFVLAVKFIVLGLTAIGISNMWLAVFADVGTALLAVLNSIRVFK